MQKNKLTHLAEKPFRVLYNEHTTPQCPASGNRGAAHGTSMDAQQHTPIYQAIEIRANWEATGFRLCMAIYRLRTEPATFAFHKDKEMNKQVEYV